MNASTGQAADSESRGHGPGPSGLLAKLLNAVRPEFRQDVLAFGPEDPVFGQKPCLVAGCPRTGRTHGMCPGHNARWKSLGQPDLHEYAATTSPKMQQHQPPKRCQGPGCHRGVRRVTPVRLCRDHDSLWSKAGSPEPASWLETLPVTQPPQAPLSAACRIPSCELWPEPHSAFCNAHHSNWLRHGQPDIDQFANGFDGPPGYEAIDLRPLSPRLRLEMQYALQRRRDDGRGRTHPSTVNVVVNFLVAKQVQSLLDLTLPEWRDAWRQRSKRRGTADYLLAALAYVHRAVEDLHLGSGWDVEYPRDVWRLRSLGFDTDIRVRFERIEQPWLKDLAKRWLRLRLSSGLSLSTIQISQLALNSFSAFLSSSTPKVTSLAEIDRLLLERYLASLSAQRMSVSVRANRVGLLNNLLQTIRIHGWDASLPANAIYLRDDYPKIGERLPRAVSEHVMAQLENPENLDRWTQPMWRLVTIILMRCGLRSSDAFKLPSDCIVRDRNQAPYLKYYNHKMKREALVPIDNDLENEIAEQWRRNQERWPEGTPVLFPRRHGNRYGSRPVGPAGYRSALITWLKQCDVRDEHDRPVRITPHQWRHTLGTRLINLDVPQEVVRRILDHDSPGMTAHYARLADTTIRRHWEKAHKVNARGKTVAFDPSGPIADAEWAKQRLSQATQALPNGYCGLPMARSCPHANSCLTCPMFLTTKEFLPQHHQQRQLTLQIITNAEERGHDRMVEMNRQVAENLDKIIGALESAEDDDPGEVADAS